MFESMSRAAAHKPDVFHPRMLVNQKISIRSVFVLAHSCFHDRSILQGGEPPLHIGARPFPRHRCDDSRLRVRIDKVSMSVIRNLQSSAFNIWHSIEKILLKHPPPHPPCPQPPAAS